VIPSLVFLFPAYRPPPVLLDLVVGTARADSSHSIIVVDDGSGAEFTDLFRTLETVCNVTVLRHSRNQGKGAALKTGFRYALDHFPRAVGVTTADADGQHRLQDILHVGRTLESHPAILVLGVRDFSRKVPFRSRTGNSMSRRLWKRITGQSLEDTQTGLRGIPMSVVPAILSLPSSRYDYELEVLATLTRLHLEVRPVPIHTIYPEGNRSSHFRLIEDTLLISKVFLRCRLRRL